MRQNRHPVMAKENLFFIPDDSDEFPKDRYDDMDSIVNVLNATERLTFSSMFVIDFTQSRVAYRTRKLMFFDDATLDDFQRESTIPYWRIAQDDDFKEMLMAKDAYLNLIKELDPEQRNCQTCVIDYRVKLKSRTYMVCQKFTPLKLDADGRLLFGLFCITSSSHKSSGHIAVFGNGFRYVYDFDGKQFYRFEKKIDLTPAEKDILIMASKGLTTEEIAYDLNKSVNTVKTHKRRIFERLQVTSMNEAVVYALNYDLF